MTIIHREGDIFTSDMMVIGHGVNMQGIMGSGIAATIRQKFPSVDADYRAAVDAGILRPGNFRLSAAQERPGLWIANISSQIETGADARLGLLRSGLDALIEELDWCGIHELALPRIGSGVGGLDWDSEVLPLIEMIDESYGEVLTIEAWTFKP